MVGNRFHAWNVLEVAPDQEPHVALGQTSSKRDPHKPRVTGRHISRKQRHAIARARGGGLRRLADGAKGKTPVAKVARQPTGFGNEVILLVKADERRLHAAPDLAVIARRSKKAEAD